MHLTVFFALLASPSLGLTSNIDITVGADAELRFNPEVVKANVGDTLTFSYFPKNHCRCPWSNQVSVLVLSRHTSYPIHFPSLLLSFLASKGIADSAFHFSGRSIELCGSLPPARRWILLRFPAPSRWTWSCRVCRYCQRYKANLDLLCPDCEKPLSERNVHGGQRAVSSSRKIRRICINILLRPPPSPNTLNAYKAHAATTSTSSSPPRIAGGVFISTNATAMGSSSSTASSTVPGSSASSSGSSSSYSKGSSDSSSSGSSGSDSGSSSGSGSSNSNNGTLTFTGAASKMSARFAVFTLMGAWAFAYACL